MNKDISKYKLNLAIWLLRILYGTSLIILALFELIFGLSILSFSNILSLRKKFLIFYVVLFSIFKILFILFLGIFIIKKKLNLSLLLSIYLSIIYFFSFIDTKLIENLTNIFYPFILYTIFNENIVGGFFITLGPLLIYLLNNNNIRLSFNILRSTYSLIFIISGLLKIFNLINFNLNINIIFILILSIFEITIGLLLLSKFLKIGSYLSIIYLISNFIINYIFIYYSSLNIFLFSSNGVVNILNTGAISAIFIILIAFVFNFLICPYSRKI